ncbi:Crp/Fnr family transcriptional regulator [Algoriphagus sp. NG3]|uniref:Crp/Fnr family transcriptional regulator n=1 Tax=Algoriphagus sp. NG3 TaxID=3097546 RepID=UPI002A834CAF|nr:Crp/Fnr family transcriptional regulator [Algoriphagus sp. NG3]WPR77629.1 Crp/Fnr family transcriptional regulator [Algoriphagus sp. NG3]
MSKRAISLIIPHMELIKLAKKHVIIHENQKNRFGYFIIKGAARSFYLQNGVEVNTWFAFEGEVVGSLRNYNNLPSRETVQMLEDSLLISFNMNEIKNLMTDHIEISNFINPTIGDYAAYLEDKLYYTHLKSAKDRFNYLMTEKPEIFLRIPLTYIASYLGISRETLSRLRSK